MAPPNLACILDRYKGRGVYELDEATNLPLIECPDCKEVRFVAYTVKKEDSENIGKRFFKCPRQRQGDKSKCQRFFFQDAYEKFLCDPSTMKLCAIDMEHRIADVHGDDDIISTVQDHRPKGDANSSNKVKHEQFPNMKDNKTIYCWLRMIAIQLMILSFLMLIGIVSQMIG